MAKPTKIPKRTRKTEPLDPDTTPPAFKGRGGPRPRQGRPKGALNKTTIVMKEAIAAVFEDLQVAHGGKGRYPHFFAWADGNPTEFYKMAARRMPVEVESAGQAIGVIVFKGINDGDDDDEEE